MDSQPDSVDTFVKQARKFLDAHAEHRPDGFPDAMYAQFRHIADREAWRANCVAWQRKLFDNGFAGLTWPREVGGRALSSAHALAWADLESEYDVPRGLFGVTLEMVGLVSFTVIVAVALTGATGCGAGGCVQQRTGNFFGRSIGGGGGVVSVTVTWILKLPVLFGV